MSFLTRADKLEIAEAIRAAEARTSGELVAVIARRSDDYLETVLLWAAGIALLVPGAALLLSLPWDVVLIYQAQLAAFLAAALLFYWTPIKRWLVPRALQQARCRRLAREQFFVQGLHLTHARTGVLLFVSIAEHYVEIVADAGINARVLQVEWAAVVDAFTRQVKAGDVKPGFLTAIGACGEKLAAHFPRPPHDQNELPNRLIEI